MKLVLFDIDGTLLNTGASGVDSAKQAIKKLYGKTPVFDVAGITGKSDKHNFGYMYKAAFNKKPTAQQLKAIKEEYLKLLPAEVAKQVKTKTYKTITGVEQLIKTLQKYENVKIGLATGNIEEAAKIKLAPGPLAKYFNVGGFGWDAEERPALLRAAVKKAEKAFKTKFAPGDVYIIGDTHNDIISAKENGYHSAIVTEAGLGDKDRILRAAAELEAKDFTEVNLWLIWMDLEADPKGVEKGAYITPASAIEHVFFSRTGIDEQRLKMFKIKKYDDLESGKI